MVKVIAWIREGKHKKTVYELTQCRNNKTFDEFRKETRTIINRMQIKYDGIDVVKGL